MGLIGFWLFMGDEKDEVVFSRRFKIQRGKNNQLAKNVSEEHCYGVLCYENDTRFSAITEIIAPVLTLEWAQRAVEILEKKLPEATIAQWEELENEMRAEGYRGATICSFYLPDAIGFDILEQTGNHTIEELEAVAEGEIEKYLIAVGYLWNSEHGTWQNREGVLWLVKQRAWRAAGSYLRSGTQYAETENNSLENVH